MCNCEDPKFGLNPFTINYFYELLDKGIKSIDKNCTICTE
jgi:hypothetical protein